MWKMIDKTINYYGAAVYKYQHTVDGWTAVLCCNVRNPSYLIYDENGQFLGALRELP